MRFRCLPRLQNEEADALASLEFRHFKTASRIDVGLSTLPFLVLNSLFAEGDVYVKELDAQRRQEAARLKGAVNDGLSAGRWK